ncbi:hypothetical protein BHE74_00016702, partial [Ensete ventricosum]
NISFYFISTCSFYFLKDDIILGLVMVASASYDGLLHNILANGFLHNILTKATKTFKHTRALIRYYRCVDLLYRIVASSTTIPRR